MPKRHGFWWLKNRIWYKDLDFEVFFFKCKKELHQEGAKRPSCKEEEEEGKVSGIELESKEPSLERFEVEDQNLNKNNILIFINCLLLTIEVNK